MADIQHVRADRIVDGLYWGNVYFVIGKPSETSKNNEVSSPPWAGQGDVFIIDKGGKTVTLFAPWQCEAHPVSRRSYEYVGCRPAHGLFDREQALRALHYGWERAGKFAIAGAFDVAAQVFQMLGEPVPIRIVVEGAEPEKPSGGKEADALGLLKPVKRSGRRGQVLAFFLPAPRSIREAMAEFDVSRSNVLSQLYLLQKEHGIGYELLGDAARIMLPAGCEDPFEPEKTA